MVLCLGLSHQGYACKPQVNLGGFIAFCQGNSITLNAGAGNPGSTFVWSTNVTTPNITVTSSGTYWVRASNVCGITYDTVVVQVDVPLNLNLGANRSICARGDTLFAPFIRGATYAWMGGGTSFGHKLFVTQSGTYSLNLTNACGQFNASVTLTADNPGNPNLGLDKFLCAPQNATLSVAANLGTYAWFKIGSGSLNRTTNSIVVNSSGSYYVEVTNVCGTVRDTIDVWYSQGAALNLGGTTTICGGGTAQLTANVNRGNYLWSTGATTKSITVTTMGTYWVQFTDACGVFRDTVQVINGGPAVVNLGPDRSICTNKGYTLDAGHPGSIYQWSTGAITQTVFINTLGKYFVGVDNGCGYTYDTINITSKSPPIPNIDDTVYVCVNNSKTLDAGAWGPISSYLWSTGATTQTILVSTPGNYTVDVGNECDTVTVNFRVEQVFPVVVDLGLDTSLCGNAYLITLPLSTKSNTFTWSNQAPDDNYIVITQSGTYWVEITNDCGTYSDTVKVELIPEPSRLRSTLKICSNPGNDNLSVPFDSSITYLWSTGATTNFININSPGQYWLYQYNQCDTLSDTINVVYDNPLLFDLGPDTVFCEPGVAFYNLGNLLADSVVWSTGSRTSGLPVTQSGIYWVKAYNACGIFTDTVMVTVKKRPQPKLTNTAFCDGTSVILNANQGNIPATYLWNTGATSASITVNQQGFYYVDISNDCATIRDSAFVRKDAIIQPVNIGRDTIFCAGTLQLDAGYLDGANYLWQDGSRNQTFVATTTGIYYVTVSNSCNSVTDTIDVLITGPPRLILGSETRFCFGSTFTLNAQNPGSSYLWSTGATSQSIAVDSGGIYFVIITNDCGQLTDTVNVIVENIMNDVELGRDTLICFGQTLRLITQYPDAQHIWTGGITDTFYDVTATGIYWARVTNTCGSWIDSIYVEVLGKPVFSLGPDTVMCAIDDSIKLIGPKGYLSYSWNGGAGPATKDLSVKQAGTYYLTIENECFFETDTIKIREEFPIDLNLGRDTALCKNLGYTITPTPIQYPIKWDDGSVRPSRIITNSGWYYANARNSCGIFTDSIYVELSPVLNPPDFDTTVCLTDIAIIDLSNLKYAFEWEDGSTEAVRKFYNPDTIALFITNECGTYQKNYRIQKVNCECPFFIPNAFTPDDDGLNDYFEIRHTCPLVEFSISIYNRWGIQVFKSSDIDAPWNGYYGGSLMPQGVYTYLIEYKYQVYQLTETRYEKGSLTLIR